MSVIEAITLFSVMVSLAALPSSSVALVVARSATLGIKNGIAVALGIVLGDLLFVFLALLGLTAVTELMGSFFAVLKVAGGIYLIWLGVALIRSSDATLKSGEPIQSGKGILLSFSAGLLLTLGDIKAILFYASFFPFFIDSSSASTIDYALVVGITIVSVGAVKILYAVFASKVAEYARKRQLSSTPQKVAGGLMVGVGSYVVFKA